MKFNKLVTRALNYALYLDLISYAGIRLALRSCDSGLFDLWGDQLIRQTIEELGEPRYRIFKEFKGIRKDGVRDFRNMYIGSPLTQLIEAHLLTKMVDEPSFNQPSSTYSYKWPNHKRSGRLYEYFFNGYREREAAIEERLLRRNQSAAVITDVHSFYPSIDMVVLKTKVESRLAEGKYMSGSERLYVKSILSSYEALDCGLPIGPALSHRFADIYLEDVDEQLNGMYPDGYFRYVDDIVIVCDYAERNQVRNDIENVLDKSNLRLNTDKTDIVHREVWEEIARGRQQWRRAERFGGLIGQLRIQFLVRPEMYGDTRKMFLDHGFRLPMQRLRSVARMGGFRGYLYFLLGGRPLRKVFGDFWRKPHELIAQAIIIRDGFVEYASYLAQRDQNITGMARRWFVQECKYVVNRLLYLMSPEDVERTCRELVEIPELFQARLVLRSLLTRDYTDAATIPGWGVRTLGELAWEDVSEGGTVDWEQLDGPEARDGAAILTLYGTTQPTEGWRRRGRSREDIALMDFCSGREPLEREFTDFSYYDEMRSLQLGSDRSDIDNLLSYRFDDEEDVILSGLMLGHGTYVS